MSSSIVRRKLAAKEPVLCIKCNFKDPVIVEMIGLMGFDCVWVCNEHVGIDPSMMESMIRACRASGMDALIRTKPGSYQDILHPLEMGAQGIMLPRVLEPDSVRKVVRDMKFFPQGRRGADGVNAEADFELMPLKKYLRFANDNNFLVVQIEDPEAIGHIEEITAIEGVDIVFVGPLDLSINMGIPGEFTHPDMVKVYEKVIAICRERGKAAGIICFTVEQAKRYLDMGFRFISGFVDYGFVRAGLDDLRKRAEKELGFTFRNNGK